MNLSILLSLLRIEVLRNCSVHIEWLIAWNQEKNEDPDQIVITSNDGDWLIERVNDPLLVWLLFTLNKLAFQVEPLHYSYFWKDWGFSNFVEGEVLGEVEEAKLA